MRVAIDIDGCLANFNISYGRLLIEKTGVNHFSEDWEKRHEDGLFPTTWNWDLDAGYTKAQMEMAWDSIIKGGKFWKSLEPLPEAKAVVKELNRMAKKGTDVYFVTHRMGVKAKQQTEEWLYELGMNYPTVLLSGEKAPLMKNLGVKFFVDDKLATMNDITRQLGTDNHYYLINRPYNNVGRDRGVKSAHTIMEALTLAGFVKESK